MAVPLVAPTRDAGTVADGLRAVRLVVLFFVLLDVTTSLLSVGADWTELGLTAWSLSAQLVLVAAGVAATLWCRVVPAVVCSVGTAGLVAVSGSTGSPIWLVVVTAAVAGAVARPVGLTLVVAAHLAWAVGFGWLAEAAQAGLGWRLGPAMTVVSALSFAAGLVARRLLRSVDRRRARVVELEAEHRVIRARERARLADELRTVVTAGLARMGAGVADAARHPDDARHLARGLDRIADESRSVLGELRGLLEVLREEGPPDPGATIDPAGGSWLGALGRRHVRLAVSAVAVLLAAAALLGGSAGAGRAGWAVLALQVLGLLAWGLAVWRPAGGAVLAGAAMLLTVALQPPGLWHLPALSLLCLVVTVRGGPRRLAPLVAGLLGYGALVALTAPAGLDLVRRLGLDAYAVAPVIAVGLTAHHLLASRAQALRRLDEAALARGRVGSEERSAAARELHDVVAHQLSVTTMLVMATEGSDDARVLASTLRRVERSTEAARRELAELVATLGGSLEPGPPPSPAGVEALADRLAGELAEQGYRPVVDLDPAAVELDPTTQRTLARIMQEAATNILRYAPAGSACHYALTLVDPGRVELRISSDLGHETRRSDLSLGWGLRGVRERVDLTRGTFSAGAERDRWVLAVSLPTTAGRTTALV